MTLDDLAKALGLSYQQVHKYENGTNRVSCGTLACIAQALGHPVDFFFPAMSRPDGKDPATFRRNVLAQLEEASDIFRNAIKELHTNGL